MGEAARQRQHGGLGRAVDGGLVRRSRLARAGGDVDDRAAGGQAPARRSWQRKKSAFALTRITRSQSSSETASSALSRMMPAELTRRLHAGPAAPASRARSAGTVTSQTQASAPAATAAARPASSLSAATTLAPRSSRSSAVARPIPLAAPVTTARVPSRPIAAYGAHRWSAQVDDVAEPLALPVEVQRQVPAEELHRACPALGAATRDVRV